MLIKVKPLTIIIIIYNNYNNLCIRYMISSASESKPFQSRSKGEILGQARQKERLNRSELNQAFLTDSDAELFIYLIQFVRFGS